MKHYFLLASLLVVIISCNRVGYGDRAFYASRSWKKKKTRISIIYLT
jgi:hypothetical protein